MKEFVAYTDGYYDMDKTHIGSSAVVIFDKEEKTVLYEWAKARRCNPTPQKQQFSQEQELAACIKAAMSVPVGSRLAIKSDSQYCVKVLGGEWNASANLWLIDTFNETVKKRLLRVTFIKVKGHSAENGGPLIWGNERADNLCEIVARKFESDGQAIFETENKCKSD